MIFGFNEPNSVLRKTRFKFGNEVKFGKGQIMTVTFDIHAGSLDHFV